MSAMRDSYLKSEEMSLEILSWKLERNLLDVVVDDVGPKARIFCRFPILLTNFDQVDQLGRFFGDTLQRPSNVNHNVIVVIRV